MTHTLNTDRTVAVSPDICWLAINNDTPRGVKVFLYGAGGTAAIGMWDGKTKYWRGWLPMPKVPESMK